MVKKILKSLGLGILYLIAGLYILFLVLPFVVNPFLSKYGSEISKMAEESCGLKVKIDKLGLVTTPKLTVGIKIKNLSAAIPTGEEFLSVDNLKAKLSIIPIVFGRIEADVFSADNIDAVLKVKPDGNLEITDYLPSESEDDTKEQFTSLPLGLKLSNRLPNVYVKEYTLTMVDMRDKREYTLQGAKLKVTDFVINKGIKVSAVGIAKLDGDEHFSFNIKVKNHIMPQIDLNDIVFGQLASDKDSENLSENSSGQPVSFNIFDVFRGIKQNGLKADALVDVDLSGKPDDVKIDGLLDVEKLSVLLDGKKLPDGHLKFNFKGNKALTDIKLFTAENEETSIAGEFLHGKKSFIDMSVKSNAGINNIFSFIKTVAKSFNIHDLDTLSADGNIDTDFTIKSDLKKLTSDGYFKIPSASVKYAAYNVSIDKINADINFRNDLIDIKNVGFYILSQPLKLFGTITHDAVSDIHLTADKLPVKGLIAVAGQVGMLKDNDIKSGVVSMDVVVKGHLKDISPVANVSVDNVNIVNKPSNTAVKLADAKLEFTAKDKTGIIDLTNLNIINPVLKFTLPKIKISADENNINISDTYLILDNSRVDISGKVTDYLNKNININLMAKGNLFANDLKSMLPADIRSMILAKGSMPVLLTVLGNDKKQTAVIQMLATPNGYFHIADLQSVAGKSLLLTSTININGDSLTFNDTGAYSVSSSVLSDKPASNIGGTKILSVTGGVSDFADLKLNSINVSASGLQTISVPSFNNSKAELNADITLNGKASAPDIKGNISCPEVNLPTIKTTLKNLTVALGKEINVNLPYIAIDNSVMKAKAVVSSNFANGIIIKSLDYNSTMFDSDTLITALANLPQQSSSSQSSDSGIVIQSGKGSITKFKSGKIIATSLTSDLNMKNNRFTLKELKGSAFDGSISGDISCNIINGRTTVKMIGEKMKAVDAINASAGIPNALSGILGFNSNLNLNAYAPTYNDMLKSVKGTITFDVKDGHYMNIGTLDQFVLAGNVVSNAVLKAALLPVKNMPVVKNSSEFSLIKGSVDMLDGIATLKPVTSSGKTVSYYVTGKYNVINGYTNVIILGRMGAEIVSVLGPLGQLSASKLTAFIPKFGAQTLNILNALTSDPANEQVSKIPALTDFGTTYKDFKVLFIGNIMSPLSVKTFKWLSECDTSDIDAGTVKEQVKAGVGAVKQMGKNNVQDVKKTVEAAKTSAQNTANDIKNQVQKTKESIEELKNLKNMFKLPSNSSGSQNSGGTSSDAATSKSSAE